MERDRVILALFNINNLINKLQQIFLYINFSYSFWFLKSIVQISFISFVVKHYIKERKKTKRVFYLRINSVTPSSKNKCKTDKIDHKSEKELIIFKMMLFEV